MDSYFNTSSVQTMNYTVGNGSGSASCSLMEVSAHPFFTVTYSLIFLVGLVLNGFTVRIYFCRAQRRQSNMTVYLQNLAVADFFLSLCLPLRIANYATHNSTLMRHVYCNFGATAFYLNMYASILFMDYIAANRYLLISEVSMSVSLYAMDLVVMSDSTGERFYKDGNSSGKNSWKCPC